jgi:hypothetical protein
LRPDPLLYWEFVIMAGAERYQHYQVLKREDGSLWECDGHHLQGVRHQFAVPGALKVINNAYLESEVARHRFLREARAAAALRFFPQFNHILQARMGGGNFRENRAAGDRCVFSDHEYSTRLQAVARPPRSDPG